MSFAAIDPLIGHAEWTEATFYVLNKGVGKTFLFLPGCPAHRAFCTNRGQSPHKHTSLIIFHEHPHEVELLITIICVLVVAASLFRSLVRDAPLLGQVEPVPNLLSIYCEPVPNLLCLPPRKRGSRNY